MRPLRVGMGVGIGRFGCRARRRQGAGRDELQQGLRGLGREVGRDIEKRAFSRHPHIGEPVHRHADRQQRHVVERGKRQRTFSLGKGNWSSCRVPDIRQPAEAFEKAQGRFASVRDAARHRAPRCIARGQQEDECETQHKHGGRTPQAGR